jgi:hypothetical protein
MSSAQNFPRGFAGDLRVGSDVAGGGSANLSVYGNITSVGGSIAASKGLTYARTLVASNIDIAVGPTYDLSVEIGTGASTAGIYLVELEVENAPPNTNYAGSLQFLLRWDGVGKAYGGAQSPPYGAGPSATLALVDADGKTLVLQGTGGEIAGSAWSLYISAVPVYTPV